jgi:DNA modification methylase
MDLQIESTTLWDFPKQNYGDTPHGNNKYNGVTPALVIWNLLQRYTQEGDLVVDPMAGSGTTIDVAKELNRKVIGYDINVVRPDVIKNDARNIPLKNDSVDFVFIDSPYSDNLNYSDSPKCIGKISCEDTKFYDELEKVAKEIARILKPEKAMGWVIGDQWIKKKFTPTGFLLWQRLEKYFEPIDIVCLTRHNQTSNTGLWHNRARRFNFYLRGFKYLFIMKKSNKEFAAN